MMRDLYTYPWTQEVGEVEQNYSNSIQKLLRSSSYSFHSNILMRWLGSEPYQEIGWVRQNFEYNISPLELFDQLLNIHYAYLWGEGGGGGGGGCCA